MLRVQNEYAKNKVQTRVSRVKAKRTGQIERETNIPKGMQLHPEVYSWKRFHLDYAMHSGIRIFNILPQFYVSSSTACFKEALKAVSLGNSARQLRQPGLMVIARRHYGEAIAALNVALNDPLLIADDSVLLTMFLFSLFEVRNLWLILFSCASRWL